MDVGVVKVAEDSDFEHVKQLVDNHAGWKLDYNKGPINVWTKTLPNTNFKMVKAPGLSSKHDRCVSLQATFLGIWPYVQQQVKAIFPEISPETMYDVLHDPDYRKNWDQHMIEAKDIGCLNPNNDVGYYSMSCPTPLANRDFVLQRSWLDLGFEKYILNHSVYHTNHPPRRGFVRAISHLTGYLVRPVQKGCELSYISQTDPQGTLPPWLVNRVTQIFGPKMVKNLQKATLGYVDWKNIHNPNYKPWNFPEQIMSPRIQAKDCVKSAVETSYKCSVTEMTSETNFSPRTKKILLKK